MTGLTRVQRKVLDAIRGYLRQHGCSPSYRDIADELGIASLSTVHDHVRALADRGAITFVSRVPRSISLIEPNALTVALPSDLDAEVRALAARTGVAPEAVVIEAVRTAMQDCAFASPSVSASRETVCADAVRAA